MTHKIYWAERGLRYLYEVVVAELFMYTFCMIFMRQDPRFTDAIWIAGIFLLSYLIRDFAPNHILLTIGHLVLAGLLSCRAQYGFEWLQGFMISGICCHVRLLMQREVPDLQI